MSCPRFEPKKLSGPLSHRCLHCSQHQDDHSAGVVDCALPAAEARSDADFCRQSRVTSNSFAHGDNQNSGNFITSTPTTRVAKPPGGGSTLSLAWGEAQSGDTAHQYQKQQRHGQLRATPIPESSEAACGSTAASDVGFGARARVTSNSYARGDNQNAGNFITSTPTTRVAKPPGGASNLSLAWGGAQSDDRGAELRSDAASGIAASVLGMSCFRFEPKKRSGPLSHRCKHCNQHQDSHSAGAKAPALPAGDGRDSEARSDAASRTAASNADFCRQSRVMLIPESSEAAWGSTAASEAAAFGVRSRVTSNSYARGDNQNSGNFITSTPTTRVAKPPGGESTLSLSWENAKCGDIVHHKRTKEIPESSEAAWGSTAASEAAAFGVRSRVTSNSYARGDNQNAGNFITSTPTTRVAKPPGGLSSLRLGWEDGEDHGNCTPRSQMPCDRGDGWDRGNCTPRSQVPCGGADIGGKTEVQGSRPRAHRPSTRSNLAHRGHASSFRADWTVDTDMVPRTKQHFPEAGGAGCNRDPNMVEALRFFQPSQNRIGKHQTPEPDHFVEDDAREQFRYFHGRDGVGKARPGDLRDEMQFLARGKNDEREHSSTRADSADNATADRKPNGVPTHMHADLDDLPLGAEWTTFCHDAEY